MNCEEIKNQILLAQSGELPDVQIKALKNHIDSCEECRQYARLLDIVSAHSNPYNVDGPSPETLAQVRNAISEGCKHKPLIMFPAFARMLAYAALFALLTGGALLIPQENSRQAGIDNLKDLIALVSDDNSFATQNNSTKDPEKELRSLAEQLLKYQQGKGVYFIDEEFLPFEPDPTASQSHNIPEDHQGKCV